MRSKLTAGMPQMTASTARRCTVRSANSVALTGPDRANATDVRARANAHPAASTVAVAAGDVCVRMVSSPEGVRQAAGWRSRSCRMLEAEEEADARHHG